jgi:hypothetical protein
MRRGTQRYDVACVVFVLRQRLGAIEGDGLGCQCGVNCLIRIKNTVLLPPLSRPFDPGVTRGRQGRTP